MSAPQFLYGDAALVSATIATAKATASGDLVGMSAGTLVRAEDTTWDTDLATTQTAFAALFLGASAQTKTSTTVARVFGNSQDNVIEVATGGVWEYDCASATFEIGDFVGPAKDTGNALLSNKVVKVTTEAKAIGRVVERGTSITRVKFKLLSVLNPAARQS